MQWLRSMFAGLQCADDGFGGSRGGEEVLCGGDGNLSGLWGLPGCLSEGSYFPAGPPGAPHPSGKPQDTLLPDVEGERAADALSGQRRQAQAPPMVQGRPIYACPIFPLGQKMILSKICKRERTESNMEAA